LERFQSFFLIYPELHHFGKDHLKILFGTMTHTIPKNNYKKEKEKNHFVYFYYSSPVAHLIRLPFSQKPSFSSPPGTVIFPLPFCFPYSHSPSYFLPFSH